jgi:hypothetical protein
VIATEADESVCTGTLIARDWVLTAAHCTLVPPLTFQGGVGGARSVEATYEHPSLDVALLRLARDRCSSSSDAPLGIATFDPALDSPRDLTRATLAGYGITENGTRGELYFVVEKVVSLDASGVMVDGQGLTGACGGDSGGPLLVRDAAGSVSVLGVLSAGSPDCRGLDYYIRVDGLRAWIEGFVKLPLQPARCGAVTEAGRCFDDRAVWCDAGLVRVERCSSACGWSAARQAYRCTDGDDARCEGDAAGSCLLIGDSGAGAYRCDQGTETLTECPARCAYAAEGGRAECVE